jgi:hypothetical protein
MSTYTVVVCPVHKSSPNFSSVTGVKQFIPTGSKLDLVAHIGETRGTNGEFVRLSVVNVHGGNPGNICSDCVQGLLAF